MYNLEKQIITLGSIAKDTTFVTRTSLLPEGSAHPPLSVSFLIEDKDRDENWGGTGANIAYSLALLGLTPTLLASLSETDDAYLESLNDLGVDVEHVHRSALPTSSFTVITDPENNQVGVFHLGATKDSESLTLEPWKDQSAFVVISAFDPEAMHRLVQECIEWEVPYCFDIGQQTNNSSLELIEEGIRGASFLIANEHEMNVLSHKLNISIDTLNKTVPFCITTYGKNGVIIDGSLMWEPIHIPAAPISGVVDPTGAGDAWRAGFFAGLARNESLYDAGLRGAVSAAYCVEQKGGQNHYYTPEEFEERLEDFKNAIPGR